MGEEKCPLSNTEPSSASTASHFGIIEIKTLRICQIKCRKCAFPVEMRIPTILTYFYSHRDIIFDHYQILQLIVPF